MAKTILAEMMAQRMAPTPPAERSIEVITDEILQLKQDAGNAILGIGQRLIEAKELLSHGEWLPWLTEKVDFSERTAQNFMRLSREWSNPQALADLGASKALTLLALPSEEREQFIAETHPVDGEEKNVVDMTTRELERAIREREEAKAEQKAAEEARKSMEESLKTANDLLRAAMEDKTAAEEAAGHLERELEELRSKPVDVAVMKVDQEKLDAARAEAVAEMQKKLDKANEAKEKAERKRKEAEEALEAAQAKLDAAGRAERQALIGNDKDLAQFEVYFNQAQEIANKMRGLLLKARGRDDKSVAEKLEKALVALGEKIKGDAQ